MLIVRLTAPYGDGIFIMRRISYLPSLISISGAGRGQLRNILTEMDFNEFLDTYPEYREELEERAAIMEYDGSLNREAAETQAVNRLKEKYKLFEQQDFVF